MKSIKYKFLHFLHLSRKEKANFVLKTFTLSLCLLNIILLPIFTFRDQFNEISKILSLVSCLFIFVYIVWKGKIIFDYIVVCSGLFVIYCFVSYLATRYSFSAFSSIVLIYSLGLSYYEFMKNTGTSKYFAYAYILSGVVLSTGIFVSNFDSIISLNIGRIGQEFGDLNYVSLTLALCFIFSLYFVLIRREKIAIFIISSAISLVFAFLTQSRGGILCLFCAGLLIVYIAVGAKHKVLFFAIFVGIILTGYLMLQIPALQDLKERILGALISLITGGSDGDGSSSTRLALIEEGLFIWTKYPITGAGLESFRYITDFNGPAHATLANLLCNLGLIGAFLLLSPFIFMIISINSKKTYSMTFVLSIGFLIPAIFVFILESSRFFILAAYIVFSFDQEYYAANIKDKCINFKKIRLFRY